MRAGSVCSGLEGATLALEPNGFEMQWFAEIDPFCSALLAHKYPKTRNYGDFTTIGPDAPPIDLLIGGTPCQSFSVAGLRQGLDDDRGNLALEYIRLTKRTKSRWLLWENVPGVLSSKRGADFACFLSGLTGVDISAPSKGWKNSGLVVGREGHHSVCWRVLDAQYFGVPQRRRRVFVVGHLGDWRCAAAVLFERESLSGDFTQSRKTRKEVAGTVKGGSGERGYPDPSDGNGGGLTTWPPKIAPTLDSHFGDKQGLENQHIDGGAGLFAEVANTLEAVGSGNQAVAFNWQENQNFKVGDTTNPLRVGQTEAVVKGMVVRRFTPRECERLQGLPDDYTLIPLRQEHIP